jgi:fucose 4-O-acetylase-like acetyltransferase
MERDAGIDWLKAFAITMVVLGHAIQYTLVKNIDANIIFRLMYSFHMPLFFFISGYLVKGDKPVAFLWKQFRLLMIPFLIWMVLYSFYYLRVDLQKGNGSVLIPYYLRVLRFPGSGGLWFLWALYLIDVVYYFLRKSRYFYLLSFGLSILLYVLIPRFPFLRYYGVGSVQFFYPYFLLGCLTYRYSLEKYLQRGVQWGLIALMLILEIAWHRVGDVYAFGWNIAHDTNSFYAIFIRILTPLPVILLLFRASRHFVGSNRVVRWLSLNTLPVYASHFVWIYGLTDLYAIWFLPHTFIEIGIVFVVASLLTWVTVWGINKTSVLRQLLFGR